MPIHDWTRAERSAFPHFHNAWLLAIAKALNEGVLPPQYYAINEVHVLGVIPDVLTLEQGSPATPAAEVSGGAPHRPPETPRVAPGRVMVKSRRKRPASRRLVVRDVAGRRLAAVVEVVSPANKEGQDGIRAFTRKAARLLSDGVHLAVLDLWPPALDRGGIHAAIARAYGGTATAPPRGKPLTLASYDAGTGEETIPYVVPAAVGDPLPALPLFLRPGEWVDMPLEAAYTEALSFVPPPIRRQLGAPGRIAGP